MSIKQSRIYLASQSPRRRELLKQIGINFELLLFRADKRRNIDVDETPLPDEAPAAYVKRLCEAKSQAGLIAVQSRKLPQLPILVADTTVTLEGKIFGKPQDLKDAASMLRALSGREHHVLTAVAIAMGNRLELKLSTSTVRFVELDEKRIHRYLQTHEYADKAGAYAIQGQASAFIEHIAGSYSGVMGLPLFETVQLLQHFDFSTP
ncbi:MAG: nucleoside triphosphate pyrophosphatase [Gallionella sp.]